MYDTQVGKRIRDVRKQKGLTLEELGKMIGTTRYTMSKYETGATTISTKKLEEIAHALRVSPAYLMDWTDNDEDALGTDTVDVPDLGQVAGGIPIDAVEDRTEKLSITESLSKTGQFCTFEIKGDSMSPKINDGDTVLVKYQQMVSSGDVAILYMHDYQVTCKQIFFLDNGSVRIHAYNESVYATKTYTKKELEEMNFQILGKVILVVRDNF